MASSKQRPPNPIHVMYAQELLARNPEASAKDLAKHISIKHRLMRRFWLTAEKVQGAWEKAKGCTCECKYCYDPMMHGHCHDKQKGCYE